MQVKDTPGCSETCTADNLNVIAKPRHDGQVLEGFEYKTGAIQISFAESEETGPRDASVHRGPLICFAILRPSYSLAPICVR